MAKVLRVVGQVAGVVATIAAFIPGGQGVAAIASAVAVVSSVGAQAVAKPPVARGQITERIIGANNPLPYLMGRSYSGGVQVHDVGYGGEVSDVDNPYRFVAVVHSCAGPVDAIESTQANFATVSFSGSAAVGYYNDYWWRDTQLGARPESDALTPQFSGTPRWGTSFKLSGFCAVGHSFKWSKKGKRFAGGQLPILGEIVRGVKVYDPRLDSTYPGGSGAHRINNEATWTYSRNPALHALTYSYGRYVNGVKVFGVDLGAASIDISSAVAWANVCDANGWNCDGTIYEPGNKWENLKRICQAGGAQPVLVGGVLRFDYQAPRTALATITRDDLGSGPLRDSLGRGWKERHNTIVPRYRSANHQWEFVQSEAVTVTDFVTEDGEIKRDEIQYDLVTDKDQAAELAVYELYQRRELGPISLPLKPHFRGYDPGDCFTLSSDLSPTGSSIKVVMRSRSIELSSGVVNCTFETENDTKHVDALGTLGTEPTSFTFPTAEELDDTAAINTSAANTIYSDGVTSVEELRPGEAGSTRNVARGTYAAGTTYVRGDSVLFSGSSYQLIVASSTGNAPPDVARWALLANAGSGPAGADGLPGLTVIVSNEAHVVATAADGSGGDYTGAGGQMRLLRGTDVLTPTFSIAAKTPNTSWISIDSSGNYTVTDPGVDLATATLRAVNVGVNYDRTYTLAKSKAGAPGTPGTNGLTNASVFIYRRSATTPALPTTTSSYTFVTGDITGLDNGWTRSVPSGTLPLYVAVAVASSGGTTDTIAAGEWSSPVVLAQDGAAGLNSASVFLYRRSASAPPVPSVTSTYTFATGVLTGQNNSWQQSVPSGADPVWIITASAAATSATDTIATGEWSSPAILAENGAQGPVGPRLQLTVDAQAFTFTDGAANPGSQTITLTALLNNLSGTATWSTTPAVTLGGSGNTRTVTVADFGANRQVTVTATLGGITDKITIVRLERDVSAPANANRVPFSRFEGGRGWGGSGAPIGGNPFPVTFDGRQFIVSQPTFTASGQFHFLFNNPPFPVVPGERLSISSLLQAFPVSGPNPINWLLFVDYRGAANNQVGSESIATALLGVSEASGRFSGFSTVPASARSAVIAISAQSAGAGQLQVGFLEPMVTSAAADQTTHPAYVPGPNASDGADPNNIITIDGNGVINGIGTASISVDNRRNALQGLLSARPASGQFIGQEYHATDTREIYQWDGSNWRTSADITATAQRSIEPQFPSIEIKQGEAGHTGNRTVTHTAKRGTATLSGGTWSLPSSNLGAGSASINSSTGTVTLSGIVQSGAYAVRYTHTDSLATDLAVNVTYVPTPPSGGTGGAKAGATTSNTGVGNDNNWNQVISLTLTGTPNPGRVFLNDFECSLSVQNGTGTCSHEARLLVNGTVVRNEGPQSTVTGGASDFIDFSSLFIGGVYAVGAANTTVSVEMRRTLGTGTISQMFNSLGCTVIAT